MLLTGEGTLLDAPAYRIVPVDTTGAGDAFNAGLIFGYGQGKRGRELLMFANACGAMAAQRVGGAQTVPSLSDIAEFQKTARA